MKTEVWPVIHYSDPSQLLRNAKIAKDLNVAGVFVISMDGRDYAIDGPIKLTRETYKGLRIGVNYLTMAPVAAVTLSRQLGHAATWTDQPMFSRGFVIGQIKEVIDCVRDFDHPFFAAIAFKGQPPDSGYSDSAGLAAYYGLIPTTSGPATGEPPIVEKITRMRSGMKPDQPLAIASGITPENARKFVDAGATHLLVATGISESFHEFDEAKLAALMRAVS